MVSESKDRYFLICERNWVYFSLIAVAGFWGAYTYLLRGNVFCNAQTGNVVLMGIAFGSGKWKTGLYYLIPIFAYVFGSFLSELLPNLTKGLLHIRWDTILILVEMLVILGLGFIPDSAPVQISQVLINFIASMQYNTFRQSEGTPMATTFATNHIRQIGVGLAKELQHRNRPDKAHRLKLAKHSKMLLFFFAGVVTGTVCCGLFAGRAIWATLLPLGVVLAALFYADETKEKDLMAQKPSGH